ncbi:MAG: DUF2312 domain-containing protein [Magnetococcus sp. DMHC-6]
MEATDAENTVQDDGLAQDHLRQIVDRIERLEEEKEGLTAHMRAVYAEAKSAGFDPKVIRKVIRIRKMDPREVDEEETLLHLYKQALGMGH